MSNKLNNELPTSLEHGFFGPETIFIAMLLVKPRKQNVASTVMCINNSSFDVKFVKLL